MLKKKKTQRTALNPLMIKKFRRAESSNWTGHNAQSKKTILRFILHVAVISLFDRFDYLNFRKGASYSRGIFR